MKNDSSMTRHNLFDSLADISNITNKCYCVQGAPRSYRRRQPSVSQRFSPSVWTRKPSCASYTRSRSFPSVPRGATPFPVPTPDLKSPPRLRAWSTRLRAKSSSRSNASKITSSRCARWAWQSTVNQRAMSRASVTSRRACWTRSCLRCCARCAMTMRRSASRLARSSTATRFACATCRSARGR